MTFEITNLQKTWNVKTKYKRSSFYFIMQNNLADQNQEVDINDVFEAILFSEEKIIEESYKKGFTIGSSKDSIEGYHLGYHRGAEIGAELGYYQAFVEHYLDDTKKFEHSEKILKNLEALKQGVESFPRTNTEQVDLFEFIEKTRSVYKKICTYLKLKIDNKSEGINF